MDQTEILALFAQRFVRREFRKRFLHEATKKPVALHRRICHDMEKVFDPKYRNQTGRFQPSDQCLLLGWFTAIKLTSWEEAQATMATGGGGYLAIRIDGASFHAETEAYPAVVYAG